MKNTLHRIKEFIDSKGITNQRFEKEVGFSNGAFASQLKNNKTIGVDKLENIINVYPELNPAWVLTGKGSMIKSEIIEPIKERELTLTFDLNKETVFFDRLDAFMRFKGLNDNQITVEAEISNGLIGKGRKRGSLGLDNISKILHRYPELDANWLITGDGDMFKRIGVNSAADKDYIIELQKDKIDSLQSKIAQLKKEYSSANTYRMVSEPAKALKKPKTKQKK